MSSKFLQQFIRSQLEDRFGKQEDGAMAKRIHQIYYSEYIGTGLDSDMPVESFRWVALFAIFLFFYFFLI
jgi:type VI protein secretion system component VasF